MNPISYHQQGTKSIADLVARTLQDTTVYLIGLIAERNIANSSYHWETSNVAFTDPLPGLYQLKLRRNEEDR